jgi:hypothetical protein
VTKIIQELLQRHEGCNITDEEKVALNRLVLGVLIQSFYEGWQYYAEIKYVLIFINILSDAVSYDNTITKYALDEIINSLIEREETRDIREIFRLVFPRLGVISSTVSLYEYNHAMFYKETAYLQYLFNKHSDWLKEYCGDGRYFLYQQNDSTDYLCFPRLLTMLVCAFLPEDIESISVKPKWLMIRGLIASIDMHLGLTKYIDMKQLTTKHPIRMPFQKNRSSNSILMVLMMVRGYAKILEDIVTPTLLSSESFVNLLLYQYRDMMLSDEQSYLCDKSYQFSHIESNDYISYLIISNNGDMVFNLLLNSEYFFQTYIPEDVLERKITKHVRSPESAMKQSKHQVTLGEACRELKPMLYERISAIVEKKVNAKNVLSESSLSSMTQQSLTLFSQPPSTNNKPGEQQQESSVKIISKFN